VTEGVEIRRMAAGDVAEVVAIEQACFSTPWTEATFRGLLRRSDADLFVAEVDGGVVGYAVAWAVLDQGELGNVAVAPAWRGRGLGARLVEIVIARSAERGVRELFLEVRLSNTRARHLYDRQGFRPVGRRRNYYSAPVEDALVLRRPLEPGADSIGGATRVIDGELP
jgi:[ribosomal protein S18]-alanine N-acetyltransferase